MASLNKSTFFLEPVVQGEVSQKEKNKYHILMPDEPIRKAAKREADHSEQTCGQSQGRRGWDKWIESMEDRVA